MINELFLSILKCALSGEPLASPEVYSEAEWEQIISLAEEHKVLALVCETIFKSPALKDEDSAVFARSRRMMRYQVITQTLKTEEFLQLNGYLQEQGLKPLVVKGIICRDLYPYPDHRISSDEDIWIPADQYERCHEALQKFGLYADADETQRMESYEVDYRKKDSPLYIELHKHLFPPESDTYGDWNRFFEGAAQRAAAETIQGRTVYTLDYTDHLFFLICHAFKHFIHSGFGIRQVCDIVMYANAYGARIDWKRAYDQCCEIHAEVFAAVMFEIGRKYLVFDPQRAGYPGEWQELAVDETAMLKDLLSGGIYGASTMSRKHSSNITLDAVSADKKGKRSAASVRGSLFPPARKLTARYPWLKKYPWLLPAAWADRIIKYHKETKNTAQNDALETIKIGNQRVELLRQYGVIK